MYYLYKICPASNDVLVCLGLTRLSTSYTLQCPFRTSVSQWDIRRRSDDKPVSIPHSASLDITLNNVNASDEGFYRCHTMSNNQPVIAPARCILILGMLYLVVWEEGNSMSLPGHFYYVTD